MRCRSLFLCLILLSFMFGCSGNKSSDQTANPNDNNLQSSSANAPASSESANTPSKSRESNRTREASRKERSEPAALVIPAGTALTVRTQNTLSSERNQSGDTFAATLAEPIRVEGKEVVPSGAEVEGTVAEAHARGKIKGAARLRLELTRLTIHGNSYPIRTSMAGFSEKGKGKRTAVTTGGGAALGAIIGGIAGGGKGAAIGALAGGGAGFAGGTLTGNKQIVLPAETALTFKLEEPVTLK